MENKNIGTLELHAVDETNFYDCLNLKRESSHYVGDAAYVLAEAYLYRHNSTAYLICKGETPVGMAILMDHPGKKNECYSFTDLFICDDFQGKGYGNKAVEAIVRKFKAESLRAKVELQVHNSNKAAIKSYKANGFVKTGTADWDSSFDVMELELDS